MRQVDLMKTSSHPILAFASGNGTFKITHLRRMRKA